MEPSALFHHSVLLHVFTVMLRDKMTPMRNEHIQYNLDGSNTDGSFTVDDSNTFLSH